jgi:AmmeMemoRadiSam system protein B
LRAGSQCAGGYLPCVVVSAAAHDGEHSIEVQLPFLQRVLGSQVELVPVVVGQVDTCRVADLIDALWPDESTAVVVSTDLSRYHDRAAASRLDRRTADAIVRRVPAAIGDYDACGRHALRGLLSSLVAETSACGRSTYAPPATPLASSAASSATAPSASLDLTGALLSAC